MHNKHNKTKLLHKAKEILSSRGSTTFTHRVAIPFEIVAMDPLKLDKAEGDYEYVLVVTNHTIIYVQAFATKNKTDKTSSR